MDKLKKYRQIIIQLLEEVKSWHNQDDEVHTELLMDKSERHFQLVNIGFRRSRRVYGCFIHLYLADDGKIWIQQDGTDLPVATELEERGIPKHDIVLAFHEPSVRPYTGFAVA